MIINYISFSIFAFYFNRNNFMFKFIPIACIALLLLSCKKPQETVRDFPQIVENDTLRVITLNTSTSYFIYRDQEMGYHYEMIESFAKEHGLELQVIVAQNSASLVPMLQRNLGDVIAYNVPVENALKDSILYCGLSEISHQVLVQRAGRNDTVLKDVDRLEGAYSETLSNNSVTVYRERATLVGPIIGAFLVNGAKSWLTVAAPEFWLYFLGGLFIAVTLFLPEGVVGLVRKLARRKKA